MTRLSKSFLFVLSILAAIAATAASLQFSGKVVKVIDGDTIEVLHDGRPERIRLNGIDCPEKNQAFGNKAKEFTAALVAGEIVTIQVKEKDRYGRTVGDVILPDNRSLTHELVRAGFAWHYKKYSDDESLQRLEQEARSAGRGLWRDSNPMPPWEFRRTGTGSAHQPQQSVKESLPEPQTITVYVTRTGSKYHRGNCRYLRKSRIPIPLEEAKRRYSPCSVCNPPL